MRYRSSIFLVTWGILASSVLFSWVDAQQPQQEMSESDPHGAHHDHSMHDEMGEHTATHTAEEHAKMIREQNQQSSDSTSVPVGVDERLGQKVPLDIAFEDSEHKAHRLGDLLDRPTLVLPVYYTCPASCMIMLGSLSGSIPKIPLEMGKAYRVIAISFDDDDDAAEAQKAKKNYTKNMGPKFDPQWWKFLVGERDQVHRFTQAIGFHFRKKGKHAFVHPNVLAVLSPDGTIIRYLYGPRFSPFDMGMALTEAAAGTPGISIRKLMTYCFAYQPESKRYVFKSFRIFGGVVLLAVVGFVFFLIRKRSDA